MPKVLPPEHPLNVEQKRTLLRIARQALTAAVRGENSPTFHVTDERLLERRGAFVTLRSGEELRGCIGHFGEDRPLYKVVAEMAIEAGLHDTRFMPVTERELDAIWIEISALTRLKPVSSPSEIVIGRDGVRVSQHGRSGTLLPQVAIENDWDIETFLNYTCEHKARLPRDAWQHGALIETYGADVFSEHDTP